MSEAGWLAYRREKDAIQAETGGSPVVRPLHAAPVQRAGQRRRLPTREDGPGGRPGSTRAPSPAVAPPADGKWGTEEAVEEERKARGERRNKVETGNEFVGEYISHLTIALVYKAQGRKTASLRSHENKNVLHASQGLL